MDSNESHQGSRAGLWSDWEKIPGFQWIPTNLNSGAVLATGRKLLIRSWAPPLPAASLRLGKDSKILMDSNESQQGSRAGLWPEAFHSVLAPPPRLP